MLNNTKSRYVIYKYEEYVGEGTKEELSIKTGLKSKYIDELSYPSKHIKKWQVEKIISRNDYFIDYCKVDYCRLKSLIAAKEYTLGELAETLGLVINTVSFKLNKEIRFKYSELEELEDLFYLESGELLRGASHDGSVRDIQKW